MPRRRLCRRRFAPRGPGAVALGRGGFRSAEAPDLLGAGGGALF